MSASHCAKCGAPLKRCAQVQNQQFCGKAQCQNERKRLWRQEKLRSDADYRENQMRAQHAWLERHPEYWSEWRAKHPEYCERNREQQQKRNTRRGKPGKGVREGLPEGIAKSDASTPAPLPMPADFSGDFWLIRMRDGVMEGLIAKSDAWPVKILPFQALAR